ncbi:hypothetical protein GCM10009675_41010 [Prauserella alba]|uniref:Uncharacterized protein n=1 Tax=Prauserella alba TaxID=176898 RepID=A0ABN1VK56_9PSEU
MAVEPYCEPVHWGALEGITRSWCWRELVAAEGYFVIDRQSTGRSVGKHNVYALQRELACRGGTRRAGADDQYVDCR